MAYIPLLHLLGSLRAAFKLLKWPQPDSVTLLPSRVMVLCPQLRGNRHNLTPLLSVLYQEKDLKQKENKCATVCTEPYK